MAWRSCRHLQFETFPSSSSPSSRSFPLVVVVVAVPFDLLLLVVGVVVGGASSEASCRRCIRLRLVAEPLSGRRRHDSVAVQICV